MDDLSSFAAYIFDAEGIEESDDSTTSVSIIYGTATSNSVDGAVMVTIGDDVVAPTDDEEEWDEVDSYEVDEDEGMDASTSVEMPTEVAVLEGDSVRIQLVGSGGLTTPTVVGVVGRGDEHAVALLTAQEAAEQAATAAASAIEDAASAKESAESAAEDAEDAKEMATSASTAASAAQSSANQALQDAASAASSASDALSAATAASTSATNALTAASEASSSATAASQSAASALLQLAVVQDVAGVLSWLQSHGSYALTQDIALVEGKTYYELVGTDYVPVTTPAVEDIGSYYELSLDSSVTDYVMAHLAVTSEGLWVLPGGEGYVQSTDTAVVPDKLYYALDNGAYVPVQPTGNESPQSQGWYEHDPATGYKSLYGPDGHRLYDGSGRLVKTEGESIDFSSTRPQHIGGEDAYILYYDSDDDGMPDSIAIGGENVSIGSKSLTEMLSDIEQQQGSVEALESFVRIVTDGATPRMVLGGSGSAIEARMTNERWGFYKGGSPDDEPITSIYVDQQTGQGVLEVANAVVVSELRLEHWAWTPRKNGNLALKWIDELVDPDPEPDPGGDDEGDGGGE